ncbi:TonB-dependent receptor [Horticoccus sp. 23ND18S-11]|uniref:TonB-dependent receptor n=1 Tax=Horticoccus sp. 23ND18S-11 TaxID=3391832 RepID=UPI0039C8FFA4
MIPLLLFVLSFRRRHARPFLFAVACGLAVGAEPVRIRFDLPSGDARPMLREFATQAKREIVFPVGSVEGVKSNAVRGEMTPQEAVDQMLAGTPLVAVADPRTGAFAIKRDAFPNAPRAALETAAVRPGPKAVPAAPAETLVLSPFEVSEASDKGYGALNSNSITRFNVELEKMPVSADILNESFMTDVGATGVESLLREYAAGAGSYGGDPAAVAGANNPMDRFDTNLSLRGMGAPTVQRDAFMPARAASTSMGFTTNFDIERVEVINGPQSLLYGFSGAGGAINLVPKQARFGRPDQGSFRFQVDQYGHKLGLLDAGAARKDLALRFVATRQTLGNRRAFIDGDLDGLYGQLAWRILGHTTVRISEGYTNYVRLYQNLTTLTALSNANDARNGLSLRYLLATNQIAAAANGQPSGAGVIGNGTLNWDNVDSTAGRFFTDFTRAHNHAVTVDSVWSRHFSTQLALGYADNKASRFANGLAQFVAPNVAANPTGTWAVAPTTVSLVGHTRAKALRFSGVLTHGLFGGRAQSQTAFGADYTRTVFNRVSRSYALAGADGNALVNPSPTAAANGFTLLARTYWAVPNGPQRDIGTFEPGARTIAYAGSNYTEVGTNEPVPALVSASNPLGLTGRGQNARNNNDTGIKGVYAANFITWLDGRLTTLAGLRAGEVHAVRDDFGTVAVPSVRNIADTTAVSFNLGANFAVRDGVRPYVSFSDSLTPPAAVRTDPYGEPQGNSRGTGGEVGVKFSNLRRTISGSVAWFLANSSNEGYQIIGALPALINPDGLNGEDRNPDSSITVKRRSSGVQVAATAALRDNWRVRLSASHFNSVIATDKSYRQYYNDQFHANAQGQVTYRDGTPVYVSSTATQVVSATTAAAVPLTIAMMNTAGNRYYANPAPETARINPASGAATVLRTVDPVHGPILTGATGLPISALQIAPLAEAPPIGNVVVSRAGDLATGNPKYSANLTAIHTFTVGWLRGVRIGGTAAKSWTVTAYPYYEGGASVAKPRRMFMMPRPVRFDGILGYERRLGRYSFSTQLNVSNLFNRYDVVLLPSATTGFGGARGSGIGATFNAEPRMYVWSATVGF